MYIFLYIPDFPNMDMIYHKVYYVKYYLTKFFISLYWKSVYGYTIFPLLFYQNH